TPIMARETIFETIVLKMLNASKEDILTNFRVMGLLKTSQKCLSCDNEMFTRKMGRHMDGFSWVCENKICCKFKNNLSIRYGSCFGRFRLPLNKLFLFIYCWSSSKNISSVCKDYSISRPALGNIFDFLREKVSSYLSREPIRLGGPGVVCQIDESLFVHKVKNHTGRSPREQVWVFGIVDTSRSPLIGHMEVVENRSAEVLLPIIQRVCKLGTIIHSDMWAGYREISTRLGFSHETVNHKLNFVNPSNGVHTQHIESFWNVQKLKIKSMKGVKIDRIQLYLDEYMWKAQNFGYEFEGILKLLRVDEI
ncbi:hypothetical protein DMUE_5937, partial [Dictyocoela muelleri]